MSNIPSKQTQTIYDFDLEDASHTVIFASPGYGKSTALQTLVMNLARQNTPEQVQFYLLDFGTNGLLPLKNLPHVIDTTSADKVEKTGKLLERIHTELSRRKQIFTKSQVANISQYNAKHPDAQLPTQVVILDNYDTIAESDGSTRDKYDALIAQVLREGAGLGVYIVFSANRVAAVKMSMQSNIRTKIALYLLNQDELLPLYGKDRLAGQETLGRGQVIVDAPRAVQIFLPAAGDNESQMLDALEAEVKALDAAWMGERPLPIPMVPDEVSAYDFVNDNQVARLAARGVLPLGYDLSDALPLGVSLDSKFFLLNYEDEEQQIPFFERLETSMQLVEGMELIVVDPDNLLKNQEISEQVQYFNEKNIAEAEAAIEAVGKDSPAMIYLLNADRFLPTITDDVAFGWLKTGFESGKHFIVGCSQKWLLKIDSKATFIKANYKEGMILMRISDQSLVQRTVGREEYLRPDEAYYWRGHKVAKTRLIKLTENEGENNE